MDSNKDKKKYLKQYETLQRRIHELELEIEAIRGKHIGRAVQYSDMPKAHNSEYDLSDMVVEIEPLTEQIRTLSAESLKKYGEISDAIEQVEELRERQVLRVRYLLCITNWDSIGELIGYSTVHAVRLHGVALAHFNIPGQS